MEAAGIEGVKYLSFIIKESVHNDLSHLLLHTGMCENPL